MKSETTSPIELALLVGRTTAARVCGVSSASWDRLTAASKNPRPLKLGGRVLWRIADLEKWIEAGCPGRKDFETLTSN